MALQFSKRRETGSEVAFRGLMASTYPQPSLLSDTQSRMTQLTSRSSGLFGSKSMPARGGVPPVSRMIVFSMSRFSAVMTLMPWR